MGIRCVEMLIDPDVPETLQVILAVAAKEPGERGECGGDSTATNIA